MRQATTGDTVMMHYTGTLDDGSTFDSSDGRDPLQVTIGNNEIIPTLEQELVGMSAGDSKNVRVEAQNAYGEKNPELVQVVERSNIPPEIDLQIGTVLQATDPTGGQTRLQVIAVDEDDVTLDANHPLAGQALTFEIQLVGFAA